MITSTGKGDQIEGLSKREQSKLQRVIKREQINKIKNEGKTCKRKSSKGPQLEEPKPRKLMNVEQKPNEIEGDEKYILVATNAPHKSSPRTCLTGTKTMKVFNPFNKNCSVEGGEEGLFSYLLGYVSNQMQAQIIEEGQDISFLDTIQGAQLEILPERANQSEFRDRLQQFEVEKHKIKSPFDQQHRKLLQKIKLKQQSK